MADELDPSTGATTLLASITVLLRRVRQGPVEGALSLPERPALSSLDRSGPTPSAALAREVQITAQAMGETVSALRARGLVDRDRDPDDGRRVLLSVTEAGQEA